MTEKYLSRPEEIVLMAVYKLKDNAYGLSIRKMIHKMTGQNWSIGAVYVPLERLEKKGYLDSRLTDPLPERGGRRKRMFSLTRAGLRELDDLHRNQVRIWEGYVALSPKNNE